MVQAGGFLRGDNFGGAGGLGFKLRVRLGIGVQGAEI